MDFLNLLNLTNQARPLFFWEFHRYTLKDRNLKKTIVKN